MPRSLIQASLNLEEVVVDEAVPTGREPPPFLSEVVTDKGYHSNYIAKTLKSAQIRSYLSEPDRGRRKIGRRIRRRRRRYMAIVDAFEGPEAKPCSGFAPSIRNAVLRIGGG